MKIQIDSINEFKKIYIQKIYLSQREENENMSKIIYESMSVYRDLMYVAVYVTCLQQNITVQNQSLLFKNSKYLNNIEKIKYFKHIS